MTAVADGGTVPGRDPGLQPERTSLAWRRTLLALLVADFFIWRSWLTHLGLERIQEHSPEQGGPGGYALGLGIAAAAAAAATVLIAGCVIARARVLRRGTDAPSAGLLRTAAVAVLLLAAAVAASIVLSR
ncbi:DUF202 domain-containing protein [Arthrobacter sp. 1P04PC]|uniref:DUF202 domain-containing protein n=1 Tax=unclassified Arthrobacter TaxID=235627 RepID=UPI00399F75EB